MASGTIPLKPGEGLDPHLMQCPRCGGETNSLTIGHLKKAELIVDRKETGEFVFYNRGKRRSVEKQLPENITLGKEQDAERYDKPIDFEPCKKCQEEIEEHARLVVEEKGAYWRCECGREGVLKREALKNIFTPEGLECLDSQRKEGKVGLQLKSCPLCSGVKNQLEFA